MLQGKKGTDNEPSRIVRMHKLHRSEEGISFLKMCPRRSLTNSFFKKNLYIFFFKKKGNEPRLESRGLASLNKKKVIRLRRKYVSPFSLIRFFLKFFF